MHGRRCRWGRLVDPCSAGPPQHNPPAWVRSQAARLLVAPRARADAAGGLTLAGSAAAFISAQVMRKDRILERDHRDYVKAERDVLTAVVHPYIVTLRYSFQVGGGRPRPGRPRQALSRREGGARLAPRCCGPTHSARLPSAVRVRRAPRFAAGSATCLRRCPPVSCTAPAVALPAPAHPRRPPRSSTSSSTSSTGGTCSSRWGPAVHIEESLGF